MDIDSWKIRRRNYRLEEMKGKLTSEKAGGHPLDSSKRVVVGQFNDPLGLMGRRGVAEEIVSEDPKQSEKTYWAYLTTQISQKYSNEGFKMSIPREEAKSKDTGSYTSYKEFITHIELLTEELNNHWRNDERVLTLKLAVKSTKILRDNIGNSSYPAIFMMTSGLIEQFGVLVFERLFNITYGSVDPHDNILPSQVSESTKETARNWFLKISCIRELHSRVFIELALLKCYKFLQLDLSNEVKRLFLQIRGLASPVMHAYASMFASKIGLSVGCLPDHILTQSLIDVCENLVRCEDLIFSLCMPALQWIFHYAFKGVSRQRTMDIVETLTRYIEGNAGILQLLVSEMPPTVLLEEVELFLRMLDHIQSLPKKLNVCIALIVGLSKAARTMENMEAIKQLWSMNNELATADFRAYVEGVSRIVEVVIVFFDASSINKILEDLVEHINRQQEPVHQHAENIIKILLEKSQSFENFLAMESFLPLLDLLTPSKKAEICHKIVEHYSREEMRLSISNPLMIHSLFTIARIVNDSLDVQQYSPEFVARASNFICKFLRSLEFDKNLEQHLTVLTEARSIFMNLDNVMESLIYSALALGVKSCRLIKGRHTRKSIAFTKACVSFAHITIPSLEGGLAQMRLYVLGSQVALLNGLIGEAESMVKAAISMIPELVGEEALLPSLQNLIGQIVMVPDNPLSTHGFLIPANGLFNAISELSSKLTKYSLFADLMNYVATQTQAKLPYSIYRVDSNDTLMSGNSDFTNDVKLMFNNLAHELLGYLSECFDKKQLSNEEAELCVKIRDTLQTVYDTEESPQVKTVINKVNGLVSGK